MLSGHYARWQRYIDDDDDDSGNRFMVLDGRAGPWCLRKTKEARPTMRGPGRRQRAVYCI